MSLPHCETLLLEPIEGVLRITLNRPQSRNAMSLAMVGELRAVLAAVRDDRSVRALVLRRKATLSQGSIDVPDSVFVLRGEVQQEVLGRISAHTARV